MILPAGPEATKMWQIRADGAGLAGRTPAGEQAWPGWEDSAVPPEKLGDYLRDLDALMARYGVDGLPYGHFGDGCVHLRIDIPLEASGSVLRTFMLEAAELVAKYGGSLSGEHGDGRARSERLPVMYSPEAIALMERFKALFDPQDVMNPGVVVRPSAVDDDLRRPHAHPLLSKVGAPGTPGTSTAAPANVTKISRRAGYQGFSFAHDHGDMTQAVHRCVGVGKCRADTSAAGGFMCPSYPATADARGLPRPRAPRPAPHRRRPATGHRDADGLPRRRLPVAQDGRHESQARSSRASSTPSWSTSTSTSPSSPAREESARRYGTGSPSQPISVCPPEVTTRRPSAPTRQVPSATLHPSVPVHVPPSASTTCGSVA